MSFIFHRDNETTWVLRRYSPGLKGDLNIEVLLYVYYNYKQNKHMVCKQCADHGMCHIDGGIESEYRICRNSGMLIEILIPELSLTTHIKICLCPKCSSRLCNYVSLCFHRVLIQMLLFFFYFFFNLYLMSQYWTIPFDFSIWIAFKRLNFDTNQTRSVKNSKW